MSYAIMSRDGSTALPRPMNRATDKDELREIVGYFLAFRATGDTWRARRAAPIYEAQVNLSKIDTDEPVVCCTRDGRPLELFAFSDVF